jgi:hypothetical protein
MILDQVNIDWLTLTTWDLPIFFRTCAWLRKEYLGGWKPAKVLQYKGQSNGSVFYGTAEQMDRNRDPKGHAMIRVSGLEAAIFFKRWQHFELSAHPGWKCSRIDLESTKEHPEGCDMRKAYKSLREPKKWTESPERTLNIGNRSESPIFVRLYEKLGYLRLELELKKGRSVWAYHELMMGTDMRDVWHNALLKSRVPTLYFEHYDEWSNGARLEYELEQVETDMQKKLIWLESLGDTIIMMRNDHTIGERVTELLGSWLES